jgi:hypothetical protein
MVLVLAWMEQTALRVTLAGVSGCPIRRQAGTAFVACGMQNGKKPVPRDSGKRVDVFGKTGRGDKRIRALACRGQAGKSEIDGPEIP